MEPYTYLFENLDEIDAMLLRLRVMSAQAKPCCVIPFRPRPEAQATIFPAGHRAHIIIYTDAVAARLEAAGAYAARYVPLEIRIEQISVEQEKERKRQSYRAKCDEIERLLDALAAPESSGSTEGRFWGNEVARGTEGEAVNFLNSEAQKNYAKRLAECEFEYEGD